MSTDSSAPVTKGDVKALLVPVQKDVDTLKTDVVLLRMDLHGFAENILKQLEALRLAIDEKFAASEERMVHSGYRRAVSPRCCRRQP